MEIVLGIVGLFIGALLGALFGAVRWRRADAARIATEHATTLERERDEAREQLRQTEAELKEASTEAARITAADEARREEIAKARDDLDAHFKGLAAQITSANSETFLKQANAQFAEQRKNADKSLEARELAVSNLVKPISESLEKIQKRSGEIEKKLSGVYEGVGKMIGTTQEQMNALRTETGRLNSALRSPRIRGRWGEQLLENLFEMSHLRENIDYRKQVTSTTDDGQQRPDFIVNIPGGKQVVIDAKVPLESYLDAHETEDEQEQAKLLNRHAASLGSHARDLGRKNYAGAIDGALDLTVLFVPADAILDAAMRANASVWEESWRQHKVLIATPSVVIALLSTIAAAWQQEQIQHNAEEIAREAGELYHRLRRYSGHIEGLRRGLQQAVTAYNNSVGSFERRLLVQARKLENLHAVRESDQFEAPDPLDAGLRRLESLDEGEE